MIQDKPRVICSWLFLLLSFECINSFWEGGFQSEFVGTKNNTLIDNF